MTYFSYFSVIFDDHGLQLIETQCRIVGVELNERNNFRDGGCFFMVLKGKGDVSNIGIYQLSAIRAILIQDINFSSKY